jgi:hypothetical protein
MYIYMLIFGLLLLIFYFEHKGGLGTRGLVFLANSMWDGKDFVGQWGWIFPTLN